MSGYISAEKLISQAKKAGIDFGNSDPYNRLRYYTKIGWLPHMERKKDSQGRVVGHYPEWTLEILILIENLKAKNISNTEITLKLGSHNVKRTIGSIFKFLETPDKRFRAAIYALLVLLLIVVVNETTNTKSELLETPVTISNEPGVIVASGSGIVLEGDTAAFVRVAQITPQSKVYVTFEDSYSPAVRFWVSRKVSFEGFYVELDSPVSQNSKFSWWVSN